MQFSIELAETDSAIFSCFPTLSELRPHIKQEEFIEQIKRQQQQGYQLAYLVDKEKLCSVAGFRLVEYLAWGKALYIDDLITACTERGNGYASALLHWLINFAKEKGCKQVHLDSGYQRHSAHSLYLKHGFHLSCHHFSLDLIS